MLHYIENSHCKSCANAYANIFKRVLTWMLIPSKFRRANENIKFFNHFGVIFKISKKLLKLHLILYNIFSFSQKKKKNGWHQLNSKRKSAEWINKKRMGGRVASKVAFSPNGFKDGGELLIYAWNSDDKILTLELFFFWGWIFRRQSVVLRRKRRHYVGHHYNGYICKTMQHILFCEIDN